MNHRTRQVDIGGVLIGNGNPVAIQSMTNTDTRDVEATAAQIKALEEHGCEIARVSVYDETCAKAVRKIKERIAIPLVADIHFDYRLAIRAMEEGADKIRINPGNIGGQDRVKQVVDAAKQHHVPIRVGVNSGSVEKEFLDKYGRCPRALCESAQKNVHLLEKLGFDDIVVSIKSSDVRECVESYRLFAQQSDRPLHLGVTEAGTYDTSIVKSSLALGALLLDGIGDTIRVSITGDPVREVEAAKSILQGLGLRAFGVEIISCPTCGRTRIPVEKIALEVQKRLSDIDKPLKIAVMGCVVNGPGEAKEADVGIAGGDGKGAIFAKGKLVKTVEEDRLAEELEMYVRAL